MSLISLAGVDHGVGGPLLLERVDLAIESGERIALIGRNGAGKSTLLRLLAGEITPDDGRIHRAAGVRVSRLAQEVPEDLDGNVFAIVAGGLGDLGAWLVEYHRLSRAGALDANALAAVQGRIEAAHGWSLDRRVAETLDRFGLDGRATFAGLSGGMKRRVLLARALVTEPDLLLLDEPTNHLDLAAIDWLQERLRARRGSLVFVTHDRRFLRELATRIVEIDRGRVTGWPGDWANYLRRRDERLHAESVENARFDKFLAQEEIWIRQGIQARRTRDEGRVRRLEALRRERAGRRERTGSVRMETAGAAASGRKVVEAEDVAFAYDSVPIVRDLTTTILRGDRIGLIGPNGSGKTTLLRILLGELTPRSGTVRLGTNLRIAYFDQHRVALREDWNALDNVAEGSEYIEIGDRRKHVLGYLQDFLFSPERARAPITRLSGGERNRLLLAKLFAKPSNLLVMDEPTNDLDVETLELLEELLGDYAGTVLLVSHDRDFLDRVVTSTLVMEGEGRVGDYVGGYSDWLAQRRPPPAAGAPPPRSSVPRASASVPRGPAAAPASRRRLGYRETRELAELPERIEALEARLAALSAQLGDADFYRRDGSAIAAHHAEVAAAQEALDAAYARWEALESGA
jgi:ATP-binding cassette subfamily F protein uup